MDLTAYRWIAETVGRGMGDSFAVDYSAANEFTK